MKLKNSAQTNMLIVKTNQFLRNFKATISASERRGSQPILVLRPVDQDNVVVIKQDRFHQLLLTEKKYHKDKEKAAATAWEKVPETV